jgi:hypothetical protein
MLFAFSFGFVHEACPCCSAAGDHTILLGVFVCALEKIKPRLLVALNHKLQTCRITCTPMRIWEPLNCTKLDGARDGRVKYKLIVATPLLACPWPKKFVVIAILLPCCWSLSNLLIILDLRS